MTGALAARRDPVGWRRLAPILAVQFVGTLGFSVALPILVFLVADLGGRPWTYGLLGATYSAAQLLGAPVLGRWSDRAGRRRVLVLSQAGTLAAWLVFLAALQVDARELGVVAGAVVSLPLLLVFAARALDGVTGGNVSVANAYVADLTREDRAGRQAAFGRMGMAASLGFTLGPALAGGLGQLGDGYSPTVLAAIVISAIGLALCLRLRDPDGRCPDGPPPQVALTRVLGQQQKRCDRVPPPAPRASLRRPLVLGLLAATFVQFLAFNLFYAGFPVHATQAAGWEPATLGLFYSVLSGTMILFQGPVLRALSARLAPGSLFAIGVSGLVGAQLAFVVPSTPLAFLGGALFAAGNGLAWPTFQARTADAATDAEQGAIQGAATSAGALASILGLTLGGVAYPWLGGGLFAVGAALFVAVLAAGPALFRSSERADR